MKPICASKLKPDEEYLQSIIEGLIDDTKKGIANGYKDVRTAHNIYTSYTVLLLFAGSGHRPVRDPFCYLDELDLENGLAVINDKVVSKAHANRIIWLPKIATGQINLYREHLNSLKQILMKDGCCPEISLNIESLLDLEVKRSNQAIPFLFFLGENFEIENVREASLDRILGDRWPFKYNIQRHILETELYSSGIHPLIINAQLSHFHSGQHPFNPDASWSPSECGKVLKPAVQQILKRQGWTLVEGLEFGKKEIIVTASCKPLFKFGPLLRKSRREEKKKNLIALLREHIREIKESDDSLSEAEVREKVVYQRLLVECGDDQEIAEYMGRVIYKLQYKTAKKSKQPLPSVYLPIKSDKSPFVDAWPLRYREGELLRNNFIEYIEQRANLNMEPSANLRWAEVCVSAIVFGGLINCEWLKIMFEGGPEKVSKLRGSAFVNIWSKENKRVDHPNWRWFIDPVSQGLYVGMTKLSTRQVDQKKCLGELKKIVNGLGLPCKRKKDAFEVICEQMLCYWQYYLPSFVYEVAIGRQKNTVLPTTVLARFITGRSICPSEETINNTVDDFICLAMPTEKAKDQKKIGFEFHKLMIRIIGEGEKERIPAKGRKIIITKVMDKFSGKHCYPPVAVAIASWVCFLCDGNVGEGKLKAINSIRRYYDAIALPLLECVSDLEFMDLSEDEFDEIYEDVVMFGDVEDREYRLRRLTSFHEFAVNNFGVEPIAIGSFMDLVGDYQKLADAKIVTIQEYILALKLISKVNDPFKKMWMGALLVLGFRFGLRIGEALRLCIENIQVHVSGRIILQIHENRFGITKTSAGVRTVKLVGVLNGVEYEFLHGLIKNVKDVSGEYPSVLLFSCENEINKPIDRVEVWRVMHHVLQRVTNDPKARFHHLRHSWVNNLLGLLFPDVVIDKLGSFSNWNDEMISSVEVQKLILESKGLDARKLLALATATGHVGPRSTLAAYIHIIDSMIYGYVSKLSCSGLTVDGARYLLNVDMNVISKRQHQHRLKKDQGYSLVQTIRHLPTIKEYKVHYCRPAERLSLESLTKEPPLSLAKIDRLLQAYVTSGRNFNNLERQTGVCLSDAVRIVNLAKDLERDSAFRMYCLQGSEDDSWVPLGNSSPGLGALSAESKKLLRMFLKFDLQSLVKRKGGATIKLVQAWTAAYVPSKKQDWLIFSRPSQLVFFLDGIKELGFPASDFVAYIGKDVEEKYIYEIKKQIRGSGITIVSNARIPQLPVRDTFTKISRIAISPDRSNAKLKYVKTLSRYIFIVGVGLKAVENRK